MFVGGAGVNIWMSRSEELLYENEELKKEIQLLRIMLFLIVRT